MSDRRTFVAGMAAAGAAALFATRNAFGASAPKSPIPIGFLGATHSHAEGKLKVVRESGDWELVGVFDESDEGPRACEKAGAPLVSREELFERARLVAVESAVRDLPANMLAALRAGKHVHVEKPACARIGEMEEAVAIAREKRLLLQTGYMWRYNPGFRAIFDAVRSGALGEVFAIRAFMGKSLDARRRREWAEFPGGSMYELGCHFVDPIVRLLGEPRATTPTLRRHGAHDDGLMDNNVVVFEFERATATIVDTALQNNSTPERSFEVLGTNGTATLRPAEPPALEFDLVEARGPWKKGRQSIELPAYRRYEDDFAELAAAARGERELSVGLDEELAVARTVLAAGGML